jgi:hypothetical protein
MPTPLRCAIRLKPPVSGGTIGCIAKRHDVQIAAAQACRDVHDRLDHVPQAEWDSGVELAFPLAVTAVWPILPRTHPRLAAITALGGVPERGSNRRGAEKPYASVRPDDTVYIRYASVLPMTSPLAASENQLARMRRLFCVRPRSVPDWSSRASTAQRGATRVLCCKIV